MSLVPCLSHSSTTPHVPFAVVSSYLSSYSATHLGNNDPWTLHVNEWFQRLKFKKSSSTLTGTNAHRWGAFSRCLASLAFSSTSSVAPLSGFQCSLLGPACGSTANYSSSTKGRQQAGAAAFLCHLATSQLYLLVFGWLPETLGVNFYRTQSVRFFIRHLCTVYVVFTSCHFVVTILQ